MKEPVLLMEQLALRVSEKVLKVWLVCWRLKVQGAWGVQVWLWGRGEEVWLKGEEVWLKVWLWGEEGAQICWELGWSERLVVVAQASLEQAENTE
jgi:hypothetical protein